MCNLKCRVNKLTNSQTHKPTNPQTHKLTNSHTHILTNTQTQKHKKRAKYIFTQCTQKIFKI